MNDTAFYSAFTKCLINKNKKFILKLLGKPTNYNDTNSKYTYTYCTTPPYYVPKCCEEYLTIKLNKKWLVKKVLLANCSTNGGYGDLIKNGK